MTHRDGFPRFSARSAWRGDARHRKPCGTPFENHGPSESHGKPPFRSRPLIPGGRQEALTMPRIARGFLTYPAKSGHDLYGSLSLILGISTPEAGACVDASRGCTYIAETPREHEPRRGQLRP